MKNNILIVTALILLVLVLIGVTIMEPVSNNYLWIRPLTPMIVITGFFTFLVAAALFIYGIINNLRR